MTVLNARSVGAGNLTEATALGIGRLVHDLRPASEPRAADRIASTARRVRLGER